MRWIGVVVVMWWMMSAGRALAGTSFVVKVDHDKVAPKVVANACARDQTASAGANDKVTVQLSAVLSSDLTLQVDNAPPVKLAAGATAATLPAGAYVNRKLVVKAGDVKVCEVMLAAGSAPAAAAGTQAATTETQTTTTETPPLTGSDAAKQQLTALAADARSFLSDLKIVNHVVATDSVLGRRFQIYHLPDGTPAFPLPSHINEKDEVEIWLVLPTNATATVDVTACDKVPAVRVAGSYAEVAGAKHSNEAVALKLESFARRLHCAGTLTYQVSVTFEGMTGQVSTSIAFDPVYRFEWWAGYMFDFGRPRSISLADRTAASGEGSEKFIVESKDYTGAKPIIALSVDICGTNPLELSWCDRLVNPTLILDPSRLTTGLGLGWMLRPFHGFGLLAGVTMFKSTQLAPGVEAKPGDTWAVTGDPPTHPTYDRHSFGFVLAATVSTEVLAALVKP